MNALFAIGILLIFVGASSATNTENSGAWMIQVGFVFLLGTLVLFQTRNVSVSERTSTWKTIEIICFSFMLLLSVWGFFNGMWEEHPLGFIIALVGCVWVYTVMRGIKGTLKKKLTDRQADQTLGTVTTIRSNLKDSNWVWLVVPVVFFVLLNFYGDRSYAPFVLTYLIVVLFLGKTIRKSITEGIDRVEKANDHRVDKLTEMQRGKEYIFSILWSVVTPMIIAFIGLNVCISLFVPITCNAFELVNVEIIPKKVCKNMTDTLSQFFADNPGGARYH